MKIFCIAILTLLVHCALYPATYYVDNTNGNDSNNGMSEGQAWKTIAKVNSKSFQAGDNILFKSGGIWREQLNISSSGTKSSPIIFKSYGRGDKPVISGANLLSGFQEHSGSVWKVAAASSPRQIFFNNIRGNKAGSLSGLKAEKDWFFGSGYLYIMAFNPSTSYSSIQAAVRQNAVNINGKNVIVKDIQVEKTADDAVYITAASENVTADNLDILQWTDEINSAKGGISVNGKNCVIQNCSFGKNTGNELQDQSWAGFVGLIISGVNTEAEGNSIYHNSIENENSNGKYAYGIRIIKASGIIKIHNNNIYHTASNGILVETSTRAGDEIRIYENEISYAGQAGISAYKTRASDGQGGKGFVYKNKVSFSNRLGGDVGGGGNRAAGIHFNDGTQPGVSSYNPFMKWYCYENTVSNSHSPKESNSPDSDGIAIDYNANNTEIYKNIIYNCDGKGIYIWNADNCKVYYNVVYGNDCGITVTASNKDGESSNNNLVYNNVFYKNYNGDSRGPNYNTEIYFGLNGNDNRFFNNILFASASGYDYYFNPKNSSGCSVDYNVVYSEKGKDAVIANDGTYGKLNFNQWRSSHSAWDKNSINNDPLFINAAGFDFRLKRNSPAVNKGTVIGIISDFLGLPVIGLPDIGAFETSGLNSKVQIKLFLEGPFKSDSMAADLQLPSSNPYNKPPWNYSGNEVISYNGKDIVDWVLIELREAAASSTKSYSSAVLLKRNGTLVSCTGQDIFINDLPGDSYYLAVYHRNHLPVMTSMPLDFLQPVIEYDFTTGLNKIYGGKSMTLLPNGSYGLISGDTDSNGIIDAHDFSAVGDEIFQQGYRNSDLDMNENVNILDYQKSLNNMSKSSQIPE